MGARPRPSARTSVGGAHARTSVGGAHATREARGARASAIGNCRVVGGAEVANAQGTLTAGPPATRGAEGAALGAQAYGQFLRAAQLSTVGGASASEPDRAQPLLVSRVELRRGDRTHGGATKRRSVRATALSGQADRWQSAHSSAARQTTPANPGERVGCLLVLF